MQRIRRVGLTLAVLGGSVGLGACSTQVEETFSTAPSRETTVSTRQQALASGVRARVRSSEELDKMQRYLTIKHDRRIISESIDVDDDETVDCIHRQLQHGIEHPIYALSTPPPEPSVQTRAQPVPAGDQPGIQRYGTKSRTCPDGTIPRLRDDLATLTRFESLTDYFQRVPSHLGQRASGALTAPTDGPVLLNQHAALRQMVANIGAESVLNIWSPYTELNSEFSLSQIWVGSAFQDATNETVETGWQVFVDKYGSSSPRFFAYFTPDNYGSGGCYNLDCGKFIQVDNTVVFGGSFTNDSVLGGAQYATPYRLQMNAAGDWWLRFNNVWVGYWPHHLFDASGLGHGAGRITFGGEILDYRNGDLHTATDMGSGRFPDAWFGWAAYLS